MENNYKKIIESDAIPGPDKYYWDYQYRLARDVIVPYLKKIGAFKESDVVTEIGCAEGGVLAAFTENGASRALGTDIAQSRLDMGKIISDIGGFPLDFVYHNIMEQQIDSKWVESSDLVILRDVIEHLDDTRLALTNIAKIIKPGGFLYVTFPPYHSPFGGHQHTVANPGGKLPYIHLLPNPIFQRFIKSGRKNDIGEVQRLQKIRLTPKKFMSAALATNYTIANADYYLLRPVFKMKFGLPTIRLTSISSLPGVKNYFSLEASYLLRKNK